MLNIPGFVVFKLRVVSFLLLKLETAKPFQVGGSNLLYALGMSLSQIIDFIKKRGNREAEHQRYRRIMNIGK